MYIYILMKGDKCVSPVRNAIARVSEFLDICKQFTHNARDSVMLP